MVKIRQPLINNLAHSQIIIYLSYKKQDYKDIASELKKQNQATIFRHMQNLRKNRWINNENQVNYDKLTAEFRAYCYSDALFSNININDLDFEVEEVMKVLFKIAVTENWKEKLGKKLTIEYIFNIIKQDIFIDTLFE